MFKLPWKILSVPLEPVKSTFTPSIIIPISPDQINTTEFKLAEMFWPFTNFG